MDSLARNRARQRHLSGEPGMTEFLLCGQRIVSKQSPGDRDVTSRFESLLRDYFGQQDARAENLAAATAIDHDVIREETL